MIAIRALFFICTAAAAMSASAQSLTLEEAVRAGEAQSPRLLAQRHALDAATSLLGRAAELPDPRLRFGIENLPLTGPGNLRYDSDFMTMRSIGLVQDFPNADKRAARGARSERMRDAERALLGAQQAALRRDVALAWFDLHYAARARAIQGTLAEQLDAQAEAVAAGVARGRQGTAESFMLRGAAGQARDRETELDRAVERARIALAVWLGGDAQRPLAGPPDTTRPPQSLAALLERLQEHPRLQVVDRREQLAHSEADLARSTKKSDWSLQIGYAQREPAFSNMLSVMVMMDLPWQAAQRQDKDIAARLAEIHQVRAQREDVRRAAEGEIRGWHADFEAAARRVERFRTSLLPLARERIEAALAAYRGGRGELGAVLEARSAATETELALNEVEARRARAWANLNFIYRSGESQ